MKAGSLDRLVTIQRKTLSQSRSGHPTDVWAAIAHRRPASVGEMSGAERNAAPQIQAQETTVFKIRWSPSVAALTPQDRIIYPPPADRNAQTPADRTVYDILVVSEIGRREGMKILAQRRNEVPPVIEATP